MTTESNSKNALLFDTIVIGSSPLLILEALSIREHGKTVAIIEKSKELGGVWHLETTVVDGVKVKHECSCHVIEWHLNGYQLLAELSGHPFETLEPQPVKVYRNGCVRCYSSRIQIALKWLHLLLLYAVGVARSSTRIGRSERVKRGLKKQQKIRKHLIAQTKFRLLGIWQFAGIKGPRGGFEEFWIALERKLEEAGIPVMKGEVISIDESGSDVKAILSDGRHIAAKEIVLGDSVRLSKINSHNVPQGELRSHFHLLVSIPTDHVSIHNSYAHCIGFSNLRRITYLKNVCTHGGIKSLYLVETLKKIESETTLAQELSEFSNYTSFFNNLSELNIVRKFEIASYKALPFDEFETTRIRPINTFGDLSLHSLMNFERKYLKNEI